MPDLPDGFRLEGAIFDLDGTLISSENLYFRAWKTAADQISVALTPELYVELMGFNRADTVRLLAQRWNSAARAEEFVAASEIHYNELANAGHTVRSGIKPLLERLRALRVPLAVATSSDRELARRTLAVTELAAYFSAVVGGDEVRQGKPDPEIYLTAASRLGVAPGRCVAFEDSVTGATAALRAGMQVVVVPELDDRATAGLSGVLRYRDHNDALVLFSSADTR